VIVVEKQVVATGYNGSVQGMPHCDEVGHDIVAGHCVRTIHAEMNALAQAARRGVAVEGSGIYTTASPCWACFRVLVNAGIRRFVYGEPYREDLHRERIGEVAEQFAAIGRSLFAGAPARCGVTAEEGMFPSVSQAMDRFLEGFATADGCPALATGAAPGGPPARRGLVASVPVSFVARVFPCVPYTHPDAAGLLVLAKLLRSGYLHREIREKGGAYGGMATYATVSGQLSLLSYRDPHLARTLGVFRDAAEWAAAGGFGRDEVKEAVLGVFSDMDTPLSPGSRGGREFARIQQGIAPEMRQSLRDGALGVTPEQLADLARRHLVEGWAASAVAVVSNETALEQANRELGAEALALERV
jgi:Zn-dependent M16 (insulinase) family peptidase